MHAIARRGFGKRPVLVAADFDGIVEIAADELHAPGRGAEPDPPRIAGNPGLRECYQLDAFGAGLVDQRDSLVDGAVEVEKHRRGLYGRDLERS